LSKDHRITFLGILSGLKLALLNVVMNKGRLNWIVALRPDRGTIYRIHGDTGEKP